MDVSKLPRLSQTPAPPPDQPAETVPVAQVPQPGFPVIPVTPQPQQVWCASCHAPNPTGTRFCGNCGGPLGARDLPRVEGGGGIEAWLSIGLGVLLLLITPRLLQYLSHVWFGTYFAPYVMPDGTHVPYTAQLDFWSDLGITLFSVVLILDGIILVLSRKTWLIGIAFALTAVATFYNLAYLVMTFSRGVAIISAFAVLFGVYIALHQWRLLQQLRGRQRA